MSATVIHRLIVTGPGELDGGKVRASDRDRSHIAEELRSHCADGRITVEELQRRVEQAMTAQTIHQLALVVQDLPAPHTPERTPRRAQRIGPPGIRPFTCRIVVPVIPERARAITLDTLAQGLNGMGYDLRHQSPESMTFRRSRKERIVIDFEAHGPNTTAMIVHGRASRAIRKYFAGFELG